VAIDQAANLQMFQVWAAMQREQPFPEHVGIKVTAEVHGDGQRCQSLEAGSDFPKGSGCDATQLIMNVKHLEGLFAPFKSNANGAIKLIMSETVTADDANDVARKNVQLPHSDGHRFNEL